MLHKLRPFIQKALNPIAKLFPKLSPNAVTIFSLFVAVLASVFFYFGTPGYLIGAVALIFFSGFLDLFDGVLARSQNRESKKGDMLDHTVDRFVDVFLILGLTFGSLVNVHFGYLAIISILLISYLGTQAQALSVKRLYAGFLGRADRIVLLMLCAITQAILTWVGFPILWKFSILEWLMLYFIFGGVGTIIQRIVTIWKNL
ncbi:MAG: CDP-alcohol phosphatidyltransferase family protein [Candidatus Undinarchaeales archaeon]|jgi:phosphatidylglycerophosphate synthase|nr:CDP-alcohol phosphatidyltransferase family protein [Candidatus Undinarchaeales archaeon]